MAAVVDHLLAAHEQIEAHKPQRGQDLRYTLSLSPQACVQGCETHLDVANVRWCPQCLGSRMTGGKPPFPCPQCRGAGEVRRPGWLLSTLSRCEVCQGEGVVVTDPCQRCTGTGAISVMRRLTIDVPAGVRDGSRLRIQGEGQPGRQGGRQATCMCTFVIRASLYSRHLHSPTPIEAYLAGQRCLDLC